MSGLDLHTFGHLVGFADTGSTERYVHLFDENIREAAGRISVIVVNGDAELMVALDVRGGETQKECEGSLQQIQVRETICSIMEGGHKAFKDRYRRIELEGDNV